MRNRLSWGLVFVLVAVTTGAFADAIPPPPTCPAGATGQSSHAGAYCAPTRTCATAAQCGGHRESCLDTSLCVAQVTQDAYAHFPPQPGDVPRHETHEEVTGTCDAHHHCAGHGRCVAIKRCVRQHL